MGGKIKEKVMGHKSTIHTERYILIGAMPFITSTGTTTFIDLDIFARADTYEEIEKLSYDFYDACAGLYRIFDTKTREFIFI